MDEVKKDMEMPKTSGIVDRIAKDPWVRSNGMHCKTCMWYVPKQVTALSTTEIGRCRRHAPVVCIGYPVVFPTDWCGDHKLDENKN